MLQVSLGLIFALIMPKRFVILNLNRYIIIFGRIEECVILARESKTNHTVRETITLMPEKVNKHFI